MWKLDPVFEMPNCSPGFSLVFFPVELGQCERAEVDGEMMNVMRGRG